MLWRKISHVLTNRGGGVRRRLPRATRRGVSRAAGRICGRRFAATVPSCGRCPGGIDLRRPASRTLRLRRRGADLALRAAARPRPEEAVRAPSTASVIARERARCSVRGTANRRVHFVPVQTRTKPSGYESPSWISGASDAGCPLSLGASCPGAWCCGDAGVGGLFEVERSAMPLKLPRDRGPGKGWCVPILPSVGRLPTPVAPTTYRSRCVSPRPEGRRGS